MNVRWVPVLFLGLLGCTTPVFVPKIVEKPVLIACTPDPVPHPELPLVRKKPYTPGQVLAGANASLIQLSSENTLLRKQLAICERKK